MVRDVVHERAPAKLNLALAVGARQESGLHPICSWMVTVDLCDEVEVRRLPSDRLSRYARLWHGEARRRSEIDWSIQVDLAVRAHVALEERVGRPLPIQLRIEKRIPVGGGLGGGSSDAAATLRAVNALYELGLGANELAEIGAGIGSDVPFLVHGGSALVEGVGERIERHERVPEIHAVLVFPQEACPTRLVYARFDEGPSRRFARDDVRALTVSAPRADAIFNDLSEAAFSIAPSLAPLATAISTLAERPAHLSGSGSTLFVLCEDARRAESLAAAIAERLGVPSVAVRTLTGTGTAAPVSGAHAAHGRRGSL